MHWYIHTYIWNFGSGNAGSASYGNRISLFLLWKCGNFPSLCYVAFMQEIESKLRTNMAASYYVGDVVSWAINPINFLLYVCKWACMKMYTHKNSYGVLSHMYFRFGSHICSFHISDHIVLLVLQALFIYFSYQYPNIFLTDLAKWANSVYVIGLCHHCIPASSWLSLSSVCTAIMATSLMGEIS